MSNIRIIRETVGLSQRRLAQVSGVSFRTIQLMESQQHDAQVSTWGKIAKALGYPNALLDLYLNDFWSQAPESILMTSKMMVANKKTDWKIWFFNFVDAFRKSPNPEALILAAPDSHLSERLRVLLAASVEQLCMERERACPWWTQAIDTLPQPWFVSGVENLKASALAESPVPFRQRNIFVMENFLERR